MTGPLPEPFVMHWRQFVAQFPVGMHQLDVMVAEDYERFIRDQILVTVRAKILAHQLAPAVIPVHVGRKVTTPVPVKRWVEEPATRWDAIKLALGVRRTRIRWRSASFYEVQEVTAWLEADEEVVVDRELHFPEAAITLPDTLGPPRLWESVRPE